MALQLLLLCLILSTNVKYLNGALNRKVTTLPEEVTREDLDSEESLEPENDDVGFIEDVDLRKFYVDKKWNNPDQAFSPCKHSIIVENILTRVLDFMGLGGNFEPKVQIKEILNDAESYVNNVPLQYQDSQLVGKLNKLVSYFNPKLGERFLRTGTTENEEKKENTTRTRVLFKEKLPKIDEPKCKKAFLKLIRDVHKKYTKLASNSCDSDLVEEEQDSKKTSKPTISGTECVLNPAYGLLLLQLRPFIIDSPYAHNIFQQLGWLLFDGNNGNFMNTELSQAQLFTLLQKIQAYKLLQNQNAFIELPLESVQYQSILSRLGGISQASQPLLYQKYQNPFTKFYNNEPVDLTSISKKLYLPSDKNYNKDLYWFLQQNPKYGKFAHFSTDRPESTYFKSNPGQNINNDKMSYLREEEYNPNDAEHLHGVPNTFSMSDSHVTSPPENILQRDFQIEEGEKIPLSHEINGNEKPSIEKLPHIRGKLPPTLLTYKHEHNIYPENKHQNFEENKKTSNILVSEHPRNTIATESVKTIPSSVEHLVSNQEQLPAHTNETDHKVVNSPNDISTDQSNGDHTIEFNGYDSLIAESKEPESIIDIIHDVIPHQQQLETDIDRNAVSSDKEHIKHQYSGEIQGNRTNISHQKTEPIKNLLNTDDAYKTHYVSSDKLVDDYLEGSEDSAQTDETHKNFLQPKLFEFEPKKYDTKPYSHISKINISNSNTNLTKPSANHGSDLLVDYAPDYDPDASETLNKPKINASGKVSSYLHKSVPKKEQFWNYYHSPKQQEIEDIEYYAQPEHKTVFTKISESHSNPTDSFGFKEYKPDTHYNSQSDGNYINTGKVENKFISYKNQKRPKTNGISWQNNLDNQGLNKEATQNLYIQTVKVKPRISKWKTSKHVKFQQKSPIKWNLEEEILQPRMWEKTVKLSPTSLNDKNNSHWLSKKKTKVVTKWNQYNTKTKPTFFKQESNPEYEIETPHETRWEKHTKIYPNKFNTEEYSESNPLELNLKYQTKWKMGSFKGRKPNPIEWNQYVKTKPKVNPKHKEEVIINWNNLIHHSPSDEEVITVPSQLDEKNFDSSSNKLHMKHDEYINDLEPTSNNYDYSGIDGDQEVINNSERSELSKNNLKGTHVTEHSYYDYNYVHGANDASQINSKKPLSTDEVLWQKTSLPEGQFLADGYSLGLNSNEQANIKEKEGVPTDYLTSLLKKLKHNPGDAELSYVIKVAPPVYRPYYYITYTIPFQTFIKNIEDLLRKHPSLSSNLDKLFQELINVSNITTVSPALKNLPKEDLSALALQDGKVSLINAKLSNQVEKIFLRSNETENKAARVEELVKGLNKLISEFSSDDSVKLQKVVGFLEKNVIPISKEHEKKTQKVLDNNESTNFKITEDSFNGKKPSLTVLGISKRSSGELVDTKDVESTTTETNKNILTTTAQH